jgi:hypothetical protein
LVKKSLSQPARDSLLPLPVPPPVVSVSLPEHITETIVTDLTITLRNVPDVVDRNSADLDDVLTVSNAAAASPRM